MGNRTYALFGVALNITNDLIDLYIRDADNEHEDKGGFCWDLKDDFEALEITDIWLNTEFEGGRHQRRIDLIEE